MVCWPIVSKAERGRHRKCIPYFGKTKVYIIRLNALAASFKEAHMIRSSQIYTPQLLFTLTNCNSLKVCILFVTYVILPKCLVLLFAKFGTREKITIGHY